MGKDESNVVDQKTKEQLLGFLNFSSGSDDPVFFSNLNQLFSSWQTIEDSSEPSCFQILDWLATETQSPCGSLSGKNLKQAEQVIKLARRKILPEYLSHHQNLLFHQPTDFIFNSFFTAQVLSNVLAAGEPFSESERILHFVFDRLNTFIGHRPVATLESQKIEPYPYEWVAPIPLHIQSVGTAFGRYQNIIKIAIDILSKTDPVILRSAHFSLDNLQQLCLDPRAFDFDHPINKRPNYHFGQWDEQSIDNSGSYYRFVIHQVTLESLLDRAQRDAVNDERLSDQLMTEAGAVLACTILMASGISGSGPGAYDSNTTLADLLPTIASYRDQFYFDLIEKLEVEHRNRLLEEADTKRQPFGAARQDLNRLLSRRRASQLVNCRLASIFARMGFANAASEQSEIVPVASARILCQIDCLLSQSQLAAQKKELKDAFQIIPSVISLLKDGIDCGAIVDPWNIIGFDANYSLFPANENTIPDHRVYELVNLVERIMGMCSLIWSEAAAVDDYQTCESIKNEFEQIVAWWRKFAPHEVMSVDAVDPEEIFLAAEFVAHALGLWQRGGVEAGKIEFWKQHADLFDSPKAYHLVISALLDKGDHQTSSALLVHWLSQAEFVRLQHGDSSFHNLIWRWITDQQKQLKVADFEARNDIWNRIRKFHDFIEANAEVYGQVPAFELGRSMLPPIDIDEDLDDEEEPDDDSGSDLFEAAYEGITYQDSTDDGVEGAIFDSGLTDHSDDELEAEVDRLFDRLEYLGTIADFWRIAATFPLPVDIQVNLSDSAIRQLKNRREILNGWIDSANINRENLTQLLKTVQNYKVPTLGVDHESLQQYDRMRLYRESLLERIVETCVQSEYAANMLAATIAAIDFLVDEKPLGAMDQESTPRSPLVSLFGAVFLMDLNEVRECFGSAIEYLQDKPLLYVPLSKGGSPMEIIDARILQEMMRDLAGNLPILGLFIETYELVSTALAMERNHRLRGAVTEFDELFQFAYSSMVKCLVQSTQLLHQKMLSSENLDEAEINEDTENLLFDCIQMVNNSFSLLWLNHSRTLRISVIEKVADSERWDELVGFIQRYGPGLFTQQFLQLSNARAILHQTVKHWLQQIRNAPGAMDLRLFDELDRAIPMERAASLLKLILEAVCENYNEYRDYNTTTTQSDQGELLYTFLDFIRLRNRYDRLSWNLKPIFWGHEILVRDGQNSVARMWRRALREEFGPEADRLLASFEDLKTRYSMQMESVARRLEGKFVHEMQIDRLRALVKPSMSKPGSKSSNRAFEKLQQETQKFIQATPGVGVDLPAWLAALEHEVSQFHLPLRLRSKNREQSLIQPIDIPVSRLREQLEQLPARQD